MSDKTILPTASEITDDVSFTEVTLDDEMIRQPSLVAHYGRVVADLQFDMENAKQVLEITESREARNMREEASEEGRKISEAQINSELPTRHNVMKARRKYNRAKADFEAGRTALEALRHKKDMMVQIGVNRRSELENKIRGLASVDGADGKARDARNEAKEAKERLSGKMN